MESTVKPTRATVSGPQSSQLIEITCQKVELLFQNPGQAPEQLKAQAEVVTSIYTVYTRCNQSSTTNH